MKRSGNPNFGNGSKSIKKRKRIEDPRYLRFEAKRKISQMEKKKNDARKKAKRSPEDVEIFHSFEFLNTKKNELFLYDYEASNNSLLPIMSLHKDGKSGTRSKMTFSEIVDYIFGDDLLDKLISLNIAESPKGLPKILYGKSMRMSVII
jgi:hypothetical protein